MKGAFFAKVLFPAMAKEIYFLAKGMIKSIYTAGLELRMPVWKPRGEKVTGKSGHFHKTP